MIENWKQINEGILSKYISNDIKEIEKRNKVN